MKQLPTLRRRERIFLDGLVSGATKTAAIRAAGFKGNHPEKAAARMLQQPRVKEAWEAMQANLAEAADVHHVAVLRQVAEIAYIPLAEARATMNVSQKLDALKTLMGYLGMVTKREQHEVKLGYADLIRQAHEGRDDDGRIIDVAPDRKQLTQ